MPGGVSGDVRLPILVLFKTQPGNLPGGLREGDT